MRQPAPAPRFSRTPGEIQGPSPRYAAHTDEVLRDWGFDPSEVERLHDVGAIASAGD
jgi:alpha-methylacyl-CoA racemase